MRKIILNSALAVASLVGMQSALLGAVPAASLRASGGTIHRAGDTARIKDFGPYTREVANLKAAAWRSAGFCCSVSKGISGWYVRVYFFN
jgi:hypothetical protein